MSEYVEKTDPVLEQLAQDIVGGRVFHSLYSLPQHEDPVEAFRDLQSSFMILALGDEAFFDQMEKNKIVCCYEYLDKAGPMAVNGRPVFFSASMLNANEQRRLHEKVLEVDALLKARRETQGGASGT